MSAGRQAKALELQPIKTKTSAVTADQKNKPPLRSILRSTHQADIPEKFDMQGAIALPREKQFALFGQWQNPKKKRGYLELRDSEAKAVVVTTTTTTPMIWHLSQLPPDTKNHTRLCALENNGRDEAKNNENFVRARVMQVHPKALCKTPAIPAAQASQRSWLPAFVFQPPGVNITLPMANPDDAIPDNAWRINLDAHQLEAHGAASVSTLPIHTSSQYFAYSPHYEHAIFGDIAGRQTGLAVRTEWEGAVHYSKMPFPLLLPSSNFRGAAWCDDSHYIIFCNDGKLFFGNTNYLTTSVTVSFDLAIHALATIPHEPVVVASHIDGSVNIYDISDALIELKHRGNEDLCQQARICQPPPAIPAAMTAAAPAATAAVTAPVRIPQLQLLTQLAPSKLGLWGIRRSEVLPDLAALHHQDHTTVLQHDRVSKKLNVFNLNRNYISQTIYNCLLECFAEAPLELIRLIVNYCLFNFQETTPIKSATTSADSASADSASAQPVAPRRFTV